MAMLPNVDRLTPPQMHQSKLIGAGIAVLVVLVLLFLANPFVQVQSGYAGVLSDFGSVQDTPLNPGLHFALPFYQTIDQVSVQPHTVTSDESGSTHDLQLVNTSIAVTFHVSPDAAPRFYQNFRDFEALGDRVIAPAVSNDVKAVTAKYDAEELVTRRDIVDAQIKELIVASLAPYHLTVEAVNVSNFAFSDAYTQAIEQKQVAQQQALQAQYTLQQTEITAQQQVVQAKAQADAAVETAQGQANALLLTSQAQSKANLLIAQSLTPPLLQQKALDRWNGALPTYLAPGTPMPFIGDAAIAGQAGK
ncbi:prohibitin family protein [Acidocella sp.]|uniref:prohibitin family protein n=1 Tax=Acidocella sp. TaxID=50710 RepID=UPI002616271D|nr:prohibitin family protein [Acidocella sp.]